MAKRGPKSARRTKAADAKSKSKASGATAENRQQTQQQQQQQQLTQQQLPLASQQVRAAGDGAVEVGDRILPRMLLFGGLPVLVGMASLPGFAYLNKEMGVDLPVWAVYIVSGLFFGTGLAGISYGIFSSSWDPNREGSLTGLDEFKENVPIYMKRDKS